MIPLPYMTEPSYHTLIPSTIILAVLPWPSFSRRLGTVLGFQLWLTLLQAQWSYGPPVIQHQIPLHWGHISPSPPSQDFLPEPSCDGACPQGMSYVFLSSGYFRKNTPSPPKTTQFSSVLGLAHLGPLRILSG